MLGSGSGSAKSEELSAASAESRVRTRSKARCRRECVSGNLRHRQQISACHKESHGKVCVVFSRASDAFQGAM